MGTVSDGAIPCGDCDLLESLIKNCDHQYQLMMDEVDVPLDYGLVAVPLFDKKLLGSAYFQVMIQQGEDRHGLRLWTPLVWDEIRMDVRFSGYIAANEGRRRLRPVVLEHLRSAYFTLPTCEHPGHDRALFSRSERKSLHLKDTSPEVLASAASMINVGACLSCITHVEDDSVIPDI